MTDIVNRLRAWADPVEQGYEVPAAGQAMRDGADEIERLRALRHAFRNAEDYDWHRLFSMLEDDDSGYGRFWSEVLQEAKEALQD